MPIAVDAQGNALRLENNQWIATQIITNDAGEVRAFDGEEWVPIQTKGTKPADVVFPGTPSDIDVDAALKQTTPIDSSPEAIARRAAESNETKRLMLEGAGAIAGGIPGAGLPARILGSAAGAALGSGVAETVDPSENPLERAAIAAATGAAGEVGGTVIAKGVEKVLAPAAKQLLPGAKEAFEAVSKEGGIITPGQIVENKLVDLAENVSEFSMLGAGKVAATRAKATEVAQNQALRFTEQFTKSADGKEVVGEAVKNAIEDGAAAFRANARVLAKEVDVLFDGKFVDLRPVKATAKRLLGEAEQGLRRSSASIRSIAKDVLDKPDFAPFEMAQTLRSDLLGVGRSSTEVITGKAQGASRLMARDVDSAIMEAGKQGAGGAAAKFREFNKFWAQGKETFNSQVIKAIGRQEPDIIANKVLRPRRPSIIRKARNTIGDEKIWNGIQGEFLKDILEKNAVDGVVDGAKVLKDLDRFGNDALTEVFDGKAIASMRRVFNTLSLTQRGTDESIGSVAIQLWQGGAAVGLFFPSGTVKAGSAGVFLGPLALSRLVTNPQTAKWLSVGLKAPSGSAAASRAFGQVAAIAMREQFRTTTP